jgi:hypothetical protein
MDPKQFQLLLSRLEKETKSLLSLQEEIYKIILGENSRLPDFVTANLLTTNAKLQDNIREHALKRITDGSNSN